jgi:hypothetical protein
VLVSTLQVGFLSGLDSQLLKMGPIRCPETSVNNYHTTPRNIPEERDLIYVHFVNNIFAFWHQYVSERAPLHHTPNTAL